MTYRPTPLVRRGNRDVVDIENASVVELLTKILTEFRLLRLQVEEMTGNLVEEKDLSDHGDI